MSDAAEVIEEEQDDMRAQIESAMAGDGAEEVDTAEVEEPSNDAESGGRPRDEHGRFVAKADKDVTDVTLDKPDTDEPPEATAAEKPEGEEQADDGTQTLAPPHGWTAAAKERWHELPEDVQQAVNQREQDVHKQLSKHDDERVFGREMHRAVQPYMAQIQAEGGTPATAVQSLLNTAYVLRTGSPEQKKQLLMQTAQQFGVDLTPSGDDGQQSPEYKALYNEISQLRSQLTSQQQAEQQQIQTEIQSELQAFAADPTHPHFEEVKAHMAALLRQGAAADLQGAYEQACWASPDIRATLLAEQKAKEEQNRRAAAKAQAENAKRKDVSVTGGPGSSTSKPAPEDRSLREELEANLAQSSGAI